MKNDNNNNYYFIINITRTPSNRSGSLLYMSTRVCPEKRYIGTNKSVADNKADLI